MYSDASATHKKLTFSAEAQILGKAKQSWAISPNDVPAQCKQVNPGGLFSDGGERRWPRGSFQLTHFIGFISAYEHTFCLV
jgi:hypothetical protein